MNKVIISGNLCRDIELRQTPNGKDVTSNCVAVQRERKEADGSYASDFINIVVWGAQATYLSNYAKKGTRVEVVGRWATRNYDDPNTGDKKRVDELVVESIKAFTKRDDNTPEDDTVEITEDELPF